MVDGIRARTIACLHWLRGHDVGSWRAPKAAFACDKLSSLRRAKDSIMLASSGARDGMT